MRIRKTALLNWRVEAAVIAHVALRAQEHERQDVAKLAEVVRAIVTAHVIAHRQRPTLKEVARVLQTRNGDAEIIGLAERSAQDGAESRAAARCRAWLKASRTDAYPDAHYLRGAIQTAIHNGETRADETLAPLDRAAAADAADRLGWELDVEDYDERTTEDDADEPAGATAGEK